MWWLMWWLVNVLLILALFWHDRQTKNIGHGMVRIYDNIRHFLHLDHIEEAVAQARPIDPDNPPTWMTYIPKRVGPVLIRCMCHQTPLRPGNSYLLWPVPMSDPVQADIFCREAVEVLSP